MSGARREEDESYGRRTAEKLQELGKRFRAVVQTANDAIVLVDAAGAIALWNAAAERMFGWKDSEALGRPFGSLFAEPSRADVAERLRRQLDEPDQAPSGHFDETAVDRGGRELPIEITLSGFSSGKTKLVSAILRDVRERRDTEAKLRTALSRAQESDRLKSAFLDNVSHEIRTPINVIVGNAEIIADHLGDVGDGSQDAAVEAMQRAGKRLVDAVGRVLDYARISAGELAPRRTRVRLRDLVVGETEDLAALAREKGVELACEGVDPRAAVYADRPCLSRALANLVDNAIKFTERGKVTVRVERDPGGGSVLEVADTGIGIEPWFRERLFEPFSQEESGDRRRYEGNGLGLAVARRYVELCGGSIEVESEKGKGSRFRIHLPGPSRPRPPADAQTLVVLGAAAGSPPWLAGLDGARVAEGAAAARQALAEERTRVGAIIVLLDLGEEAFAFARELREDPWWWDLPIVGVFAAGGEWSRGRALAAGLDEVMADPAGPAELRAMIDRI